MVVFRLFWKVKWGTKGVIPLSLKVNQAILMAGREAETAMQFFAKTLVFSS
jgi:hypothetical protein